MSFKRASIITVLVIILNVCFSFNVGALTLKEHNLDIDLPDGFTVITPDNIEDYPDFLVESGMDKKSFSAYTEKNGIILFATDFNTKKEIILTSTTNEFSANVEDLGLLDAQATQKIGDSIFGENEYKTVTIDDYFKFFSSEYKSKDNGGEFYGLHYIMIRNGDIYNFSFSSPQQISAEDTETAEKAFLSITFKKNDISYADIGSTLTQIFIILGILCFVGLIIYIVYLFIADIRNKRNTSDVAPYVKIKRRRF